MDDSLNYRYSPCKDNALNFDCGIAYARFEVWLRDELALHFDGTCWLFPTPHGVCHVRISPLESRKLGAVQLERCRLVATGDAEALAVFNKTFTLRSISAGG